MWTIDQIDAMPLHFILCTERTGSSLLTVMLNMHPALLTASEEPFALYFYQQYGNKKRWDEIEIRSFVTKFFTLFEKNASLYYEKEEVLLSNLLTYSNDLNYERLIKLCYLHFYDGEVKNKQSIRIIIDKQMKFVFHPNELLRLFPSAKILILTRKVLANIQAKKRRKIDFWSHPYYLANIWKMTYESCLKFPNHEIFHFESLIKNPEVTLEKVSMFFGVSFNENQLKYQEGFSKLLENRNERISPEFKRRISDFHSGLLGHLRPETQTNEEFIQSKQKNLILKKTHELNIFLGYFNSKEHDAFNLKEEISWGFYRLLALLFRKYLWISYRWLPLELKLKLRKNKNHMP